MGGNYLDGTMMGGNYLDGGKLTKKGVKLRKAKSVMKRDAIEYSQVYAPAAGKKFNPWLEYVALERNKKANAKLTYKELLQNIDKDAYARWKKKHYPADEPAKKAPKKKVVKKEVKKAAPKKKAQKKA